MSTVTLADLVDDFNRDKYLEYVDEERKEKGLPHKFRFRKKLTVADHEWLLRQEADTSMEMRKARLLLSVGGR